MKHNRLGQSKPMRKTNKTGKRPRKSIGNTTNAEKYTFVHKEIL